MCPAWRPAYVCLDESQSHEPRLVKKRAPVISQLKCLIWQGELGRGCQLFFMGGAVGRGDLGQGGSQLVGLPPRHNSVPRSRHWERVITLVRTAWAEELKGERAWPKSHDQVLIWPKPCFQRTSLPSAHVCLCSALHTCLSFPSHSPVPLHACLPHVQPSQLRMSVSIYLLQHT